MVQPKHESGYLTPRTNRKSRSPRNDNSAHVGDKKSPAGISRRRLQYHPNHPMHKAKQHAPRRHRRRHTLTTPEPQTHSTTHAACPCGAHRLRRARALPNLLGVRVYLLQPLRQGFHSSDVLVACGQPALQGSDRVKELLLRACILFTGSRSFRARVASNQRAAFTAAVPEVLCFRANCASCASHCCSQERAVL